MSLVVQVRYCCLACIYVYLHLHLHLHLGLHLRLHLQANMIASKNGVYAQHVSIRDSTGSKVPSSPVVSSFCFVLLGASNVVQEKIKRSHFMVDHSL